MLVLSLAASATTAIDGAVGAAERTTFERPVYVTTRGIKFDLTEGPHVIDRFVIDATGQLVSGGQLAATAASSRSPAPTGVTGTSIIPTGGRFHYRQPGTHDIYGFRIGPHGELFDVPGPHAWPRTRPDNRLTWEATAASTTSAAYASNARRARRSHSHAMTLPAR